MIEDSWTGPVPDDAALMERFELMCEIADRAEPINLEHYQRPTLRVDRKADGSVVTPADRGTEEMARELIRERFPDDGITGEEFGSHRGESSFAWIIDPIDGTDSYTRGIPTFANLIAVVRDGIPVLGLANFPALAERVVAVEGCGCCWRSRGLGVVRAGVSGTDDLADALIEMNRSGAFAYHGRMDLHNALARRAAKTRGWSDAYAFALVATGRIDAAIALRMSIWDVAPFDVILREAGGEASEWDGSKPLSGESTLVTNGLLHASMLQMIESNPKVVRS